MSYFSTGKGYFALSYNLFVNCDLITTRMCFSEDIFKKAGSSMSPSIATIVVGLVMFAASFPTPYLIEKLGRRMIQILSAAGMMIFLVISIDFCVKTFKIYFCKFLFFIFRPS